MSFAGCGQPEGQISFDGDITTTGSEFRMEGQIEDGTAPTHIYRNVTVYLYSTDGNVIKKKE